MAGYIKTVTRQPCLPLHDMPLSTSGKSIKSIHGTKDATTSDGNLHWEISSSSLPLLPEIYPSIRNTLVVRDLSVGTVTTRISCFMRLNDIQCQFNVRPGRAVCSTPRIPKFCVQLWERRQKGSTNDLLVEIQRRRGCSISMQRIRSAIARAIISSDYQFDLSPRSIRPIPLTIKRLDEENRQLERDMDLEVCIRLLESPRSDQKQLGMESLSILTDPSKVNPDDAYEISRTLVCRHGKYGKMLQNEVEDFLHLVQEKGFGDEYCDSMCSALQAISNALDLLHASHGSLEELKNPSGLLAIFWTNITHILIKTANRELGYAHHAVTAAKIIRALELLTSDDLKQTQSESHQSPISTAVFFPEVTKRIHISNDVGR
jgi:hypothetical protein